MKRKITTDPKMLDALIVIYSFNEASAGLLQRSLQLDGTRVSGILNQLSELGILRATGTGRMDLITRKYEAWNIMNNNGVYYDTVKFYEGIYQYQSMIQAKFPEMIRPVESAIIASQHDANNAALKLKYEGINKKLQPFIKVLLMIVIILGALELWKALT